MLEGPAQDQGSACDACGVRGLHGRSGQPQLLEGTQSAERGGGDRILGPAWAPRE